MKLEETRLGPILDAVQAAAERRRRTTDLEALRATSPKTGGRAVFVDALRGGPLAILAEHKRHSPTVGSLKDTSTVADRCSAYAQGGARALSILTEEDHFQGSLDHLQEAATAGLPRLRKDFLLDPWMVEESAAAGADAVLLLAVCLPDARLEEMTCLAQEHDMAVLLEVHDEEELARALAVQPDCIGINARDLRSFAIDLQTTLRLLPQVPERFVRIAESGLEDLEDLHAVRHAGADAALIGSALMRAPHLLADWTRRLAEEETR